MLAELGPIERLQRAKECCQFPHFLVRKRDRPEFLRVVSSQGRFRADASGRLRGSNPEDPLDRELQRLSLAELRERVQEAWVIVQESRITPQPYPSWAPSWEPSSP